MKKIIIVIAFFLFVISGCEAIFVGDISNKKVELISPHDKVEVPKGEVNFNWSSIEDAEHYKLQIATPNFNNPIQVVTDTIISKTIFKKVLVVNEYEWRVKAQNSEYETMYSTKAFTVK